MPDTGRNAQIGIDDRLHIERGIARKDSMSKIAREIGASPSSVIREIKRNRVPESSRYLVAQARNICLRARLCKKAGLCDNGCMMFCRNCQGGKCNELCSDFLADPCPMLEKPPYCCNECANRYGHGCDHPYMFYDPYMANELAKKRRSESRAGIDCTEEELERINFIVTPLVHQGQSPEHVWASHAQELSITPRTYRNYVEAGIVDVINFHLPKRNRYKPRKKKDGPKEEAPSMEGHLYEDFLALPEEKRAKAVQMDCVEGRQGEVPAILTLTFPLLEFQVLMYLERKDQIHVKLAIDQIQSLLGDSFAELFEVILTDRGSEFKDHQKIEYGKNGVKRCSVYYCDPQRSDQKGFCERNHAELRRIIPKGTSLRKFEKTDMAVLGSHLNSYLRPRLNYTSPISNARKAGLGELVDGLSYALLELDEVVMRPYLIKDILAR